MECNIRKATKEDIQTICEFGRNVSGFETAEDVVGFWPKEILENCVGREEVLILVASIEENIIGFFIININIFLKNAILENMYVIEEYRNKGVGKLLLQESLKEVIKIGIENVCAMADEAADFLEANGFSKGRHFCWMNLILGDGFKR
ncbi:MAG: GNAT family N-acetyltransferase [Oscillospiraceae bacterium]|nr:GNAT family N-acetyltransferase [Oscillospiraceae bacterium]